MAWSFAVAWAPGFVAAQSIPAGVAVDPVPFDYHLKARAVADGVFVVAGANADFHPGNGCNIINTGFIVTDVGVLVINTGPSRRYGEQLRALIAVTTPLPLRRVINLNQHPDYFLGNQAFDDLPIAATSATLKGMRRESRAYEDNLYRVCGDWMAGTATRLPDAVLAAGSLRLGEREFELVELRGHTASDAVLVDRARGVAFVGGLVFSERIPTTPHAVLADWLASLATLQGLAEHQGLTTLVPSHGSVTAGFDALRQTVNYLRWIDQQFHLWASQGREMNGVLRAEMPEPFRHWAAFPVEYARNVAHLYPRYEREALAAGR
jgi:quinoprotein relay system zinc metallohydrolase 1